uniref:Single-strand selective monofunctional uracil DNA glycosylase n=1 Tax=Phallusia mammillata TaxID=59560 RepID=A0A6F9DTS5_9ASCI|nr:single-strand selective monofunctional uracil DNA glycosylase [Phallusia mammillata]
MDAYFHEALLKQRQQQQQLQHTDTGLSPIAGTGGFDFTSFSHLAQAAAAGGVAPAAAVVGKQAVLAAGIAQEYFDAQQWKEKQSHGGVIMPGASSHILYNNNTNSGNQNIQAAVGHQQLTASQADFDMLAAAQNNVRSYMSGAEHGALLTHDTLATKCEPLDQMIPSNDSASSYSSQETAIINQHQELDAHQEQVSSAEYSEANFNSQLVLAFLWIEAKLCAKLKLLTYCDRVSYVYNPLEYASDPHAHYVSKYCGTKTILFLGMNPGPFGMAQNGVPFGDTRYVREWLKISGQVHSPEHEHPKRPIHGLECTRSEVSGARFWGFMAKICGTPEQFFQNCFVHNYCPLVFITKTGKNVIPAALPAYDRRALEEVCDNALLECIRVLRVQIIVAVGKYAAERALHVLRSSGDDSSASIRVERILHPSPASPQANSGWEEVVTRQLQESGILQFITANT